jgi:hypothetical protein
MSMLLHFSSSSFDVTIYLNSQGDLTSSSSTVLPLLLVSSLDTLLLTLCLFDNLSPSVLMSSKKLSLVHYRSAVSFLFILGLTPRSSLLGIIFLLLRSSFILSLSLLACLSSIFLSSSSGSILSSPHLILWTPSTQSILLLSYFFPYPPQCKGI